MKPWRTVFIVCTVLSVLSVALADDEPGHSQHGAAFDSGLRQRPWRMEGIGKTHFPITTKVPEVQEWFDQGNTLLHSFWYEEAERSFRWCLKLDSDCAMAYWGLARGGGIDAQEGNRYREFLQEAIWRKDRVSPRERNKDGNYGAYDQGLIALVRALIKFERWDEILKPGAIPWRDLPGDKERRAFAETLAYIGQGKLTDASARLDDLKATDRAQAAKDNPAPPSIPVDTAEGLLRAAQGDLLEATHLLTEAASLEQKQREAHQYRNDPPNDPWPVMRVLGDVYLKRGEYRLAVEAYQRSLALVRNDAFSLSGLAQAEFALGDRAKAERDYGRLLAVWSGADPNLKWRKAVAALGLEAKPIAETPVPERPYRPEELASLGPINWEPYAAPKLDGVDVNGRPVGLEEFRGKNVLLVFYLNDECAHCVEQLTAINARSADWSQENTAVLGVSSVSPEKNKSSQKLGSLAIRLLSDTNHENARRFASYDDFEGIELHSTILIDRQGRVNWKRTGGDPFTDVEFLLQTVKRMNGEAAKS